MASKLIGIVGETSTGKSTSIKHSQSRRDVHHQRG
jgi:dephospho-CoA kinase